METVEPNKKFFFIFGISMKICFKNNVKPYQNQKELKYEQVYFWCYLKGDIKTLDIISLFYACKKNKKKKTDNKPNKCEYTVLPQKTNSNIGLLPAELEFHCKGRLRWDQLGLRVKQPSSQSNRCNEVIFSGV